ncbi:CLUMA_CG009588, isoform A [Clunio marinus]|uniref:CLUMA_CG009588, isoform A n=1 Tax=Clunio marinus TaxID=568069 RepID=A0A1J1I769_9DIPT|nr:CLUMA_CG009588, isoform A [Clunio marinus]
MFFVYKCFNLLHYHQQANLTTNNLVSIFKRYHHENYRSKNSLLIFLFMRFLCDCLTEEFMRILWETFF